MLNCSLTPKVGRYPMLVMEFHSRALSEVARARHVHAAGGNQRGIVVERFSVGTVSREPTPRPLTTSPSSPYSCCSRRAARETRPP